MATLSDMIDEVRSNLAGYTLRQDRITYLNAAITTTDTAIQVGSSSNLARVLLRLMMNSSGLTTLSRQTTH